MMLPEMVFNKGLSQNRRICRRKDVLQITIQGCLFISLFHLLSLTINSLTLNRALLFPDCNCHCNIPPSFLLGQDAVAILEVSS